MLDKVRKNLNEGIKQVKWFAAFLSERTKAEASIARLLYESSKLEARLDELYREIGKRALEVKDKGEKDIFKDFIILQTLNEINKLKEDINDYKKKADEHGRPQISTDNLS